MKKFLSLSLLFATAWLLAWCHDNIENTNNADYFSAFWTEPYRDLEISGWIAKLSSPMYDTNYETSVNIRKDWENYYFTWEELEWEFIKNDCIDWWKWDLHYYTVWVAKFREYSYEWCWDINGEIKMTDEEYESTLWNNTNEWTPYEWTLFVAWVWPEQSWEPAVAEWTLVLKQNYEDHTDHLFINEWWENYLWNEKFALIPWSTILFKWTVEEIDAWAWNHYYEVQWFETLSFVYNEADTCNLDNDCLPENWFWNDILAELDNCNVTSVFQTHSLKVWATTKDGNTFESVEPKIDDIVHAAQSASEKCDYEIMIATE